VRYLHLRDLRCAIAIDGSGASRRTRRSEGRVGGSRAIDRSHQIFNRVGAV